MARALMWAMICAFGLALSDAAQAEIVWQPPWVEDPSDPQWQGGSVTHQVWEFNDDPIVPMISENPFGLAQIEVIGGSYPDPVIGPDGVTLLNTWHIDQDGGSLVISVPNDPRPNDRKVIFIQPRIARNSPRGMATSAIWKNT